MQAYYEIETAIPVSHQITIHLPDTIPPGKAKIAVIYEMTDSATNKDLRMKEFLAELPDNADTGLSREKIQDYLVQERQNWDD